ncbi:hypothetical protein GCM10022409_06240 [Hymenobacter glaciei]|uniref:Uncharacterized protein n=1 Tax=Hymenobacter glaciei TaxID=877209 RepID=A0ABP7TEL0_9BACT
MKYLVNLAWILILLGLALTTAGWALKLHGHQQADTLLMAGNGLVLLFGAMALWKLVRRLDVGLRGPLGVIAAGLLISLLATSSLVASAALELALLGGSLATGGTVWLLFRLNRTLDRPLGTKQQKYSA